MCQGKYRQHVIYLFNKVELLNVQYLEQDTILLIYHLMPEADLLINRIL